MGTPERNESSVESSEDLHEAQQSPDEKADELLDQLRRERASFLNYKRRIEQERLQDRDRARSEVVQPLIELIDELERALEEIPADLSDHPWVRGIELIHRRLVELLHSEGIERLGVEGERFDPGLHEAVFYEQRPDVDEHEVVSVIQPGYRIGSRVIRPAYVSVAGPANSEQSTSSLEGGPNDATSDRR